VTLQKHTRASIKHKVQGSQMALNVVKEVQDKQPLNTLCNKSELYLKAQILIRLWLICLTVLVCRSRVGQGRWCHVLAMWRIVVKIVSQCNTAPLCWRISGLFQIKQIFYTPQSRIHDTMHNSILRY
jgi:hypothetical protein